MTTTSLETLLIHMLAACIGVACVTLSMFYDHFFLCRFAFLFFLSFSLSLVFRNSTPSIPKTGYFFLDFPFHRRRISMCRTRQYISVYFIAFFIHSLAKFFSFFQLQCAVIVAMTLIDTVHHLVFLISTHNFRRLKIFLFSFWNDIHFLRDQI